MKEEDCKPWKVIFGKVSNLSPHETCIGILLLHLVNSISTTLNAPHSKRGVFYSQSPTTWSSACCARVKTCTLPWANPTCWGLMRQVSWFVSLHLKYRFSNKLKLHFALYSVTSFFFFSCAVICRSSSFIWKKGRGNKMYSYIRVWKSFDKNI